MYRVHSDITVGDVSSYVADKNVEVRKKSQEGSKLMSFQVTVKVTHLNTVTARILALWSLYETDSISKTRFS